MLRDDQQPPPIPRKLPVQTSDEQLWSWLDRDAPELAKHLEDHPEDQSRVDELRRAIRAVGSSGDERIPDRIGPYPIVSRLGSGGMGVVFEAEQVHPARRVALKVIRGAWLDDKRTRALFRRETEVLARLQHPGIASIFDAGETQEGAPYFVMELVEGLPLDEWTAAGQSESDKLRVGEEIANAVHHAHEKGVIHRDLKPSNVFVTTDRESVKVLDFGLARIVDPSAGASLTAAVSGKVIGTVRYMSPEQAQGMASKVTPASDVYSIGVLLYEMFLGVPPHDFDGKGLFECAREVAEKDVIRPSVVLPSISADTEAVLCKALARDPAERYATAHELGADLYRLRMGIDVLAEAPRSTSTDSLEATFERWGRQFGAAASKASTEARSATIKIKGAVNSARGHMNSLGRAADTHRTKRRARRTERQQKSHSEEPSETPTGKTIHIDLDAAIDRVKRSAQRTGIAVQKTRRGVATVASKLRTNSRQRIFNVFRFATITITLLWVFDLVSIVDVVDGIGQFIADIWDAIFGNF